MITIYDISQVEFSLPFFIIAMASILVGLVISRSKMASLSKKELESPFEKITNLIELKNKQDKSKMIIKSMGLFLIIIGFVILFIGFKPIVYSKYLSDIKKNEIISGIVTNYSAIEFLETQIINFSVNNVEFSFTKDQKVVSNKTIGNGDSIVVWYVELEENDILKTVTKINLKTGHNKKSGWN